MASCNTKFESVFRHCDLNGDGKISPEELQHCVELVGAEISQKEVESIVNSLDSDGDGMLSLEEFVELVKGEEDEEMKDLKEAFGMYVMEGGDGITPNSLKRMLSRLGESRSVDECRMMISQFDLNGDGVLSFDEFRSMME
ncbi:hypothetical protein ACHQM5_005981 [Ranunculus cassubicifolius]